MSSPVSSSPPRTAPQSQRLSFIAGTTVENTPVQQCTADSVTSYPPFLSGTTVENTPIQQSTPHNTMLDAPVSSEVALEDKSSESDMVSIPDFKERDDGDGSVIELPDLVTAETSRERSIVERSTEIPDSEAFEDQELDHSSFDGVLVGRSIERDKSPTGDKNIGGNAFTVGSLVTQESATEEPQLQSLDETTCNDGGIKDTTFVAMVGKQHAELSTSLPIKHTAYEQPRAPAEESAASTEPAHLDRLSIPISSGGNDIFATLARKTEAKYEELAANNALKSGATEVGPPSEILRRTTNDISRNFATHGTNDGAHLDTPSSLSVNSQNLSTIVNIPCSGTMPEAPFSPPQHNITRRSPASETLSSPIKISTPHPSPTKQILVSDSRSSKAAEELTTPSKDQLLMTELKSMKMSSIQARNASLEAEISRTQAKTDDITQTLTAPATDIVKSHIKLLHTYNDIRDVGQGLLGMIADNRGVRVGELYKEFGVGLKD